jgi:hypothetical protein
MLGRFGRSLYSRSQVIACHHTDELIVNFISIVVVTTGVEPGAFWNIWQVHRPADLVVSAVV